MEGGGKPLTPDSSAREVRLKNKLFRQRVAKVPDRKYRLFFFSLKRVDKQVFLLFGIGKQRKIYSSRDEIFDF